MKVSMAISRYFLVALSLFLCGGTGSAFAQDAQGRYELTARADNSTAISVQRGDTFTVDFGIRFLGDTGDTEDDQPNRLRLFGIDARVFGGRVDVGTAIPATVSSHVAISGAMLAPTAVYLDGTGINLLEPAGATVTLTEDSVDNAVIYMYLRGLDSENERVPCNEDGCVLERLIQVTYRVSEDAPIGEFTIGNVSSSSADLRGFDSYIGAPEITRQAFRVAVVPGLTLSSSAIPGEPGITILNIEAGQPAEVLVSASAPPADTVSVTVRAIFAGTTRVITVELSPGSFASVSALFTGSNSLDRPGVWRITAEDETERVAGVDNADAVLVDVREMGAALVAFSGTDTVLSSSELGTEAVASVTVTDENNDGLAVIFDVIEWQVEADGEEQRDSLFNSADILFSLYDNQNASVAGSPDISTATIGSEDTGLLVKFTLASTATIRAASGVPVSAVYELRAQLSAGLAGSAEIDNSAYVIALSDIALSSGDSPAGIHVAGAQGDTDRAGLTVQIEGAELRWLDAAGSDVDFTEPGTPTLSVQAGMPATLAAEVTDAAGNRDLDVMDAAEIMVTVQVDGQPAGTAGDVVSVTETAAGVVTFTWERWPGQDNEVAQIEAVRDGLVTVTSVTVDTDAVAEILLATQTIDNDTGTLPNSVATTVTLSYQVVDCVTPNDENRPCVPDLDHSGNVNVAITYDNNDLSSVTTDGDDLTSGDTREIEVVGALATISTVIVATLAEGASSAVLEYSTAFLGTPYPLSQMVTPTEVEVLDLSLTATPSTVPVNGSFSVEVLASAPVPAGSTVTVTVLAEGANPPNDTVVLSAGEISVVTASFSAPASRGALQLVTTNTVAVDDPGALALTVNDAPVITVDVAAGMETLTLTLDAPPSVTVGQGYAVMVSTDLPVPQEATVTVTVSFGEAEEEVVLTDTVTEGTANFTAPLMAGEVSLTATGIAMVANPDVLVLQVDDAEPSAITVVATSLTLVLEGGLSSGDVLLLGDEVTLLLTSAPEPTAEVEVTVTANGVSPGTETSVVTTLSPTMPTAAVTFTDLDANVWSFSASSSPVGVTEFDGVQPSVTIRAQTVQVDLPPAADRVVLTDSPITFVVAAPSLLLQPVELGLQLTLVSDPSITRSSNARISAGESTAEIAFAGLPEEGEWSLSVVDAQGVVPGGVTLLVNSLQVVRPQIVLTPDPSIVAQGGELTLAVQIMENVMAPGLSQAATVNVTAALEPTDGGAMTTATFQIDLPATDSPSAEITIGGELTAQAGDLTFTAEVTPESASRAVAAVMATVRRAELVVMVPVSAILSRPVELEVTLTEEIAPSQQVTVTFIASLPDMTSMTSVPLVLEPGEGSGISPAMFSSLGLGCWAIAYETAPADSIDVQLQPQDRCINVSASLALELASEVDGDLRSLPSGSEVDFRVGSTGTGDTTSFELAAMPVSTGSSDTRLMSVVMGEAPIAGSTVMVSFAAGQLAPGGWYFELSDVNGILSAVTLGNGSSPALTVSEPAPVTLSLSGAAVLTELSGLRAPAGAPLDVMLQAADGSIDERVGDVAITVSAMLGGSTVPAVPNVVMLSSVNLSGETMFGVGSLGAGVWTVTGIDALAADGLSGAVRVTSEMIEIFLPQITLEPSAPTVAIGGVLGLTVRADSPPGLPVMLTVQASLDDVEIASATVTLDPANDSVEVNFLEALTDTTGQLTFQVIAATPDGFVALPPAAMVTVAPTVLSLTAVATDARELSVTVQAAPPLATDVTVRLRAEREGGALQGADGMQSDAVVESSTIELTVSESVAVQTLGPVSPGSWSVTLEILDVPAGISTGTAVVVDVLPTAVSLSLVGSSTVPAGSAADILVTADSAPALAVDAAVTAIEMGSSSTAIVRVRLGPDMSTGMVTFAAGALVPGEWSFTVIGEPAGLIGTDSLDNALTVEAPVQVALTLRVPQISLGASLLLDLAVVPGMAISESLGDVEVVIMATSPGLETVVSDGVILSSDSTSAIVQFEPRELAPGTWTFTGSDSVGALAVVPEIGVEVTVVQPLVTVSLQLPPGQGSLVSGSALTVAVSAASTPGENVQITITAMSEGAEPVSREVALSTTNTVGTAVFEEGALQDGDWSLSAEASTSTALAPLSAASAVILASAAVGEVRLATPRVSLLPRVSRVTEGSAVEVDVRSEIALSDGSLELVGPADSVDVSIVATGTDDAGQPLMMQEQNVLLTPSLSTALVTFSALTSGVWLLGAEFVDAAQSELLDLTGSTASVMVGLPQVSLALPQARFLRAGGLFVEDTDPVMVMVTIDAGETLSATVTLTVQFTNDDVQGSTQTLMLDLGPSASEGTLEFTSLEIGTWTFQVVGSSPNRVVGTDDARVTVEGVEGARILTDLNISPSDIRVGAMANLRIERSQSGIELTVPLYLDGSLDRDITFMAGDSSATGQVGSALSLGSHVYTIGTTDEVANEDEVANMGSDMLLFQQALNVRAGVDLQIEGTARVGLPTTVRLTLLDSSDMGHLLDSSLTATIELAPPTGSSLSPESRSIEIEIAQNDSSGTGTFTPDIAGTWSLSVAQSEILEQGTVDVSVRDALLLVADLAATAEAGDTVQIQLELGSRPSSAVTATVTATRSDDALSASLLAASVPSSFVQTAEFNPAAPAVFPASTSAQFPDLAPGAWSFAVTVSGPAELDDPASQGLQVNPSAVTLTLADGEQQMAGSAVQVDVTAGRAPVVLVSLTVTATNADGVTQSEVVSLDAGDTTVSAVFAANVLLPGVWSFSVTASPAGALAVSDAAAGPLTLLEPEVTLTLVDAGPLPAGSEVSLTVGLGLSATPSADITVTVLAVRQGGSLLTVRADPAMLTESNGYSMSVTFAQNMLFPGTWRFSAVVAGPASPSENLPELTINAPVVSLSLPLAEVVERSTAEVVVRIAPAAALETTVMVTVQATLEGETADALEAVMLTTDAPEATAVLPMGMLTQVGDWVVAVTEITPSGAASFDGNSATLVVRLPQVILSSESGDVDPILNIPVSTTAVVLVSAEAPGPRESVMVNVTATLGSTSTSSTVTVELAPGAYTDIPAVFDMNQLTLAGSWQITATPATPNIVVDAIPVNVRVRPAGAGIVVFTDTGAGSPTVLDTSMAGASPMPVASVEIRDESSDGLAIRFDAVEWRVQAASMALADNLTDSNSDVVFSLHALDSTPISATQTLTRSGAEVVLVRFALAEAANLSADSSGSTSTVYELRAQIRAGVQDRTDIDNSVYIVGVSTITLTAGSAEIDIEGARRTEDSADLLITVTGTELAWAVGDQSAVAGQPLALSLWQQDAQGNRDLDVSASLTDLSVEVFSSDDSPLSSDDSPLSSTGDSISDVRVEAAQVLFNWERWPSVDSEQAEIDAVLGTLRTAERIAVTTDAEAERFTLAVSLTTDDGTGTGSEALVSSLLNGLATTMNLTVRAVAGGENCSADTVRPCVDDVDYTGDLRITPTWDEIQFSLEIGGVSASSGAAFPQIAGGGLWAAGEGISVERILMPVLTDSFTDSILTLAVADASTTDALAGAAIAIPVEERPAAELVFTQAADPLLLDSIAARSAPVTLATLRVEDGIADGLAVTYDVFTWQIEGETAAVTMAESLFEITMLQDDAELPGTFEYEPAVSTAGRSTREFHFTLNDPQVLNTAPEAGTDVAATYMLQVQYQTSGIPDGTAYTFRLDAVSLAAGGALPVQTDVSALTDRDVQVQTAVEGTELRWLEAGSDADFTEPGTPTLTVQAGTTATLVVEATDAAGNRDLDVTDAAALTVAVQVGNQPAETAGDIVSVTETTTGVITFTWERWPGADGEEAEIQAVLDASRTALSIRVTTEAEAERLVTGSIMLTVPNVLGQPMIVDNLQNALANTLTFTVRAVDGGADCLTNTLRPCLDDTDYQGNLMLTPTWGALSALLIDGTASTSGISLDEIAVSSATWAAGMGADVSLVLTPTLMDGVAEADLAIAIASGTLMASSINSRVVLPQIPTVTLEPAAQTLLVNGIPVVRAVISPLPAQPVTITVTAVLSEPVMMVASSPVSLQAEEPTADIVFAGPLSAAGEWRLQVNIVEGDAEPGDGASARVLETALPVALRVSPAQVVEGAEIQLAAMLSAGTATQAVQLSVDITAPDGSQTIQQLILGSGADESTAALVLDMPGEWAFEVTGSVPAIVALGASATAQVVRPVLQLSPLTQTLPAGSEVAVAVTAAPALAPAAQVQVQVTASLVGDTSTQITASTVTLTASALTQMAVFAADVLAAGDWIFSMSTSGSPVEAASTARVSLERGVLSLSPAWQLVLSSSIAQLSVASDRPLSRDVSVTGIATLADMSTTRMSIALLPMSGDPVDLEFSLPDGEWIISLSADERIVDPLSSTAVVVSRDGGVPVTLSTIPSGNVIPGARVTLTAVADERVPPVALTVRAELQSGTTSLSIEQRTFTIDLVDIQEGSATFLPDMPGEWRFSIQRANLNILSVAGVSAMLTVLPPRLNFSTPNRSVNADDLILAVRYIRLCVNSAETDCTDPDMLPGLNLARNLTGGAASYRLNDLIASPTSRGLVVPDLTGDGVGNAADILILHRFLSTTIPAAFLFPASIPAEDRDILIGILNQAAES